MAIFDFLRKKAHDFFSTAEQELILEEIRKAERRTSGEVRVFIESRCRYVNALDRASEIFFSLKMEETIHRNAVLVYLAVRDRQLAIFADKGIYEALGEAYWNKEAATLISSFKKENYGEGLANVVSDIGQALHHHFPYDLKGDKNELPDDIVFGH